MLEGRARISRLIDWLDILQSTSPSAGERAQVKVASEWFCFVADSVPALAESRNRSNNLTDVSAIRDWIDSYDSVGSVQSPLESKHLRRRPTR